nr:TPA_asm: oncoid [Megastigmus wasp adintovirus]
MILVLHPYLPKFDSVLEVIKGVDSQCDCSTCDKAFALCSLQDWSSIPLTSLYFLLITRVSYNDVMHQLSTPVKLKTFKFL